MRSTLVAAALLAPHAYAQPGVGLLPVSVRLNATAIKPEQGLSGVVGAAFLPNGTIIVGDAGRRSIHQFDATGKYLGSFGRSGQGPGEFVDLLWLLACTDGSILAFDGSLYRITVFDRHGTYSKVIVPPAWFSFDTVLSCDDPTSVVFLQDMPRSKPTLRGKAVTYPAVVAKANWMNTTIDTVTVLSGTEYFFAKARGFIDLPLGARAIAASAGGFIVAGVSSDTNVLFFGPRRRHADTLRVSNARMRTAPDDWQNATRERLEREYTVRTREMAQTVLREAEPPSYLPVFDALFVDRYSMTAWARLFTRNERAEWIGLNSVSGKRSRFLLPTNVQVMDIAQSRILGLQRNNDGTEELLIYNFQR